MYGACLKSMRSGFVAAQEGRFCSSCHTRVWGECALALGAAQYLAPAIDLPMVEHLSAFFCQIEQGNYEQSRRFHPFTP